MGNTCYAFPNAACGGCDSGCFCAAYWEPAPSPFPKWDTKKAGGAGWNPDSTSKPDCKCGLGGGFIGGITIACIALVITIVFCVLYCREEEKKTEKAKNFFITLNVFLNVFTSALVFGIFMGVSAGSVKDNQCYYNEYDMVVSWLTWALCTTVFTSIGVCCIVYTYETIDGPTQKRPQKKSSTKALPSFDGEGDV